MEYRLPGVHYLRYETLDSKFLFIVCYVPDGSKQIFDKKGALTRMLVRGESLNI